MLPSILNEHQIHPFNFYLDGDIRQGMRYQAELYGLAATFDKAQRTKAYDLANSLAASNCDAIVTVAKQYKVWIRLTASTYANWQHCISQSQISQSQISQSQISQSQISQSQISQSQISQPSVNQLPVNQPVLQLDGCVVSKAANVEASASRKIFCTLPHFFGSTFCPAFAG
jgi:hypothetical protein